VATSQEHSKPGRLLRDCGLWRPLPPPSMSAWHLVSARTISELIMVLAYRFECWSVSSTRRWLHSTRRLGPAAGLSAAHMAEAHSAPPRWSGPMRRSLPRTLSIALRAQRKSALGGARLGPARFGTLDDALAVLRSGVKASPEHSDAHFDRCLKEKKKERWDC